MDGSQIENIIHSQRAFFASGKTLPYDFRIQQLKKLKHLIQKNESTILEALYSDLKKSNFEAFGSEISLVYKEIDIALKNLKRWIQPQCTTCSITSFPSKNEIRSDPRGLCLLIAPWNYPFQLSMGPLVGALAAGNTVILKPSEVSIHTEKLLRELINKNFDSNYLCVLTGGKEMAQVLLHERFDFIFYTGNTHVGKIVMKAAAEHLTPVCLELGGKSPSIVDETAHLEITAKRIVWGKFLNAGQTCVAPDYVYVHEKHKSTFINLLKKSIRDFYGENEKISGDYGRIISEAHFDRLLHILEKSKILYGGDHEKSKLYISPTLLDVSNWDEPSMQDEIFGPLLPVLSYKNFDELISLLKTKEKPLALYYFSKNSTRIEKVLSELSFGGGCINDCLIHVSNFDLPFGGVGQSGMGSYHGKYSFDIFSHKKSIVKKNNFFDPDLRYPPYTENKIKYLKKFL